jgi:arylformamidase
MQQTRKEPSVLNITVPESGELEGEIRLARWLVRVGEAVRAGEAVAEIETDKGVLAIEAPASGTLLEMTVEAGAETGPGAVLGVLGVPGERISGSAPAAPPPAAATPAPGAAPPPAAATPAPGAAGGRVRASPAVRKLAASLGVDLGLLEGSGPGGLVTRRDVLEAAPAGGTSSEAKGPRPGGTLPAGKAEGLGRIAATPAGGERRLARGRFVDLSHLLYPGREEYSLELETHDTTELYPQYAKNRDVWYILQTLHMSSHCGTHIEFPYHHNRTGLDAGRFPLERLITPALLLDFRHKQAGEPVTRAELEPFAGRILQGDAVLFHFGCDRFYRTERSHERPTLEHEAVRWLALEKKINLIGSDASGIELKGMPNQPNHQLLMDNQIPIIEFAANLGALRRERFLLFVLALPITGLDSCPVRLVALEED